MGRTMIATTFALLIIESFLLGDSLADSSTFETPVPGLEQLPVQSQTKLENQVEKASYPVDSAARGTVVFLLPPGPRTLQSFELTPSDATRKAWKSARVRLLWDTDEPSEPGVDLPIELFFGGIDDAKAPWVNRLPMPYRQRAMLVIDTEEPLSGRLKVESAKEVRPDAGYLRAARLGDEPIEETGRGKLVAVAAFDADESRNWNLSTDGGDLGAVGGLLDRHADEGKSSPGGKVSWFSEPRVLKKSFRLKSSRPSASPAALFWYTDRPTSGRSSRDKQP